jgi:fibronectin type 3 domain-containing protein
VVASVVGQDVSLSWSASTDNDGVTGYEVHRSATAGFTPSSATRIGTPEGTSFTDTAVTGGTWFYKVTAVDAAGNVSGPSAEASAVVAAPADTQAPTVPSALLASAWGT